MDIITMVDSALKSQAFKLKGRLYTFTVLQVLTADIPVFSDNLAVTIAKAPKLFDNTPIVLDFSMIAEEDHIDLDAFFACLHQHNTFPAAIQGANAFLTTLARTKGIAVLNASSSHDKPLVEESRSEANGAVSKIHTMPVRSGQQVVGKGGDLIITASVSHGAELLADGNIHVYGALRGRALAGISGDRNARIFCQTMEAELVSIAGFYRLRDAIEPCAGPCQIYLQDDHICIDPL